MRQHTETERATSLPAPDPAPAPVRPRHAALQLRISERRLVLMLGDVALSLLAVLAALRIWAWGASYPFDQRFLLPHAYWFVVLPLLWVALAQANDYYNLRHTARLRDSLNRLFWIVVQLLAIYVAIFFLSPRGSLPRRFIAYYAVISLALIGAWRGCRLFLVGWTEFRQRAIIVGTGRAADMIRQVLVEEARADYNVIGHVASEYELAGLMGHPEVLGTGARLPELARQHGVTELVMAYVDEVPDDVFRGVMICYERGVRVVPMPLLYEQITGRVPVEQVGDHLWTLVLPANRHGLVFGARMLTKRLLDVCFAALGLLLCAPVLPLLALLIRLDSRGPVFYRQKRMGQGGRLFVVYKLRTMATDAECDGQPRWAAARDPRVTRVGRLLRKVRLDEVPQLLNVLRGEMSLVGPRPERPEFVELLARRIPLYRTRLVVKPGLTGWAQIRFSYTNTVEETVQKLQYDLYYIRHQTVMLDLLILVRTIGTILLLRGT